MIKNLAPTLLLILCLLFSLAPPARALEPGTQAPDFELPTLSGEKIRLSDFRGRIILLKLATTWCPTCKQQTEAIEEAGKFLAENDVVVVEVFVQDSEKMVRQYFQGREFPMAHQALLDDTQVYKAYNVYLIPRVLLIDREFKVRRDGSLMPAREIRDEVGKIKASD